jgi:enolase
MAELYAELVDGYPIRSIEDRLAEDYRDGWQQLTDRLGQRVQLVGDDFFVTNPTIIARAVERGVGSAALIKLNQIGTVTETSRRCAFAGRPGTPRWCHTVPARPPTPSSPISPAIRLSLKCLWRQAWCTSC